MVALGLFHTIWLILFFNKKSSLFQKATTTVFLGALSIWTIHPDLVFAGLFNFNSATAEAPRSPSLQNLPILQAHLSPMLLAQADRITPITDDDSLSAPFSLYDEENIILPERDEITTYVVKSGDTLSGIAEKYEISPNTIRWANNIPIKAGIKIGQELLILPITGIRHKVNKGDTLATIAKKYKSDADDIASFNGLESGEKLTAGTYLIIPNGEMNIPTEKITVKEPKTRANLPSAPSTTNNVLDGYFIKPVVNGILTQGYHDRYNALDISLPRGQAIGAPILAAADGVVIVAKPSGWNGAYGQMVIIQHDNGIQTLYAHLSSVKVSTGQHVSQGQVIGGMGNTGRSTGPHLHFEVRGAKTPMLYSKR